MVERCNGQDCRGEICELLKKLPPNYPVHMIYLNGIAVEVWAFSNIDCEKCLAHFINIDGQVVIFDVAKIDGISFGEKVDDDDFEDC